MHVKSNCYRLLRIGVRLCDLNLNVPIVQNADRCALQVVILSGSVPNAACTHKHFNLETRWSPLIEINEVEENSNTVKCNCIWT